MNNVKSVMNYFDGNFLFNLYLKNIIGNTNDESYMYEDNLLNDINKNAVIMGCICNIMTSIKDGLNDKTNNFNKYFSEIVNKELSDNILMIASKNKDGYAIDDYTFKNASSILATLRNKLSYGNFALDLEQGNVTFKVNNKDVSIDIDTLANYVISSLWTYMRIDDSNKYMRNIVVTNKFDNSRSTNMKNRFELKSFIRSFKEIDFSLSRKDNQRIEGYVINRLEELIKEFKISHDFKIFNDFQKEIKDKYNFNCHHGKVRNINIDGILDDLSSIMIDDIDYDTQVYLIGIEMQKLVDDNNYNNAIKANLRNLILINTMYKCNSTDNMVIGKEMVNNYGIVDINYDNYVANEIAMFNSLFSYANDELYKNNNKYSNLNSDGLDYGMLNLSGIRLNTINLNDNVITRLLSEKIRIQKEISKINDMITIYNSNLDIVILKKNIKAIEKISELLKSEFEKLDVLQSLYTATENSLSFARTYYNNNVNCLTNEAIITGIRNSIAHGNYNIVNDDDKIKIVFNDKVNNKLVFSCEVFINDFRDILINSAAVVKSFIDNKYNDKNIVKVKSLVIV